MANRVVITLAGVRYPLRTVEDPAYVNTLAGEMDIALRKVMGEGNLSLSEALILIGLEYLDSYKKADVNLDNMRSQIAEYMDAVKQAESELAEAKNEIKRLRKKN
ncbi:MAG: cell division protein ZapA [Oscillospiraceae bacterium]|nr:cell division protein ZapA [Oscillospiraceae bacterium]